MNKAEIRSAIATNPHWYHKGFAGYLFGIDEQTMAIALAGAQHVPYAPDYGVMFVNQTKPDYFDWFWDERVLEKNRQAILEMSKQDLDYVQTFFADHERAYKGYVEKYDQVDYRAVWAGKGNVDDIKSLHHLVSEQAKLGYVVDNFLTTGEDWLVAAIKKYLGENVDAETIRILTAPQFISFVNIYEGKLAALATEIARGAEQASVQRLAESVAYDFRWVRASYQDYALLQVQEVLNEAQVFLAEKKASSEEVGVIHNKQAREKFYAEHTVSEELQRIVQMAHLLAQVQDRRKECVLRHNFLFFGLLESLSRQYEVDPRVCFAMKFEQLIDCMENGVFNKELLLQRAFNPFAVIYFNGEAEFFYGDDISKNFSLNLFFETDTGVKEFKGTPAFRGHVKGKVRVLFSTADMAHFKDGEVLVTNQTTPEFVPAMKKAVAVVTDQGGITSHASIVSRELGVPCVVGTRVATKVLKTGDMVEVDADAGVVRIL